MLEDLICIYGEREENFLTAAHILLKERKPLSGTLSTGKWMQTFDYIEVKVNKEVAGYNPTDKIRSSPPFVNFIGTESRPFVSVCNMVALLLLWQG